MNTILNISIAAVFILIVITASIIFTGNDDKELVNDDQLIESKNDNEKEIGKETSKELDSKNDGSEDEVEIPKETDLDKENALEDEQESEVDENEDLGTVIIEPSEDAVVLETRVNPGWQPIKTEQTGSHISSYDGKSIDWIEKQKAIAYATGDSVDSLVFWKVKNGGSPEKSIGIVESKETSEKYRVYIEWVNGEGWQPVKVDVLNTLDFAY